MPVPACCSISAFSTGSTRRSKTRRQDTRSTNAKDELKEKAAHYRRNNIRPVLVHGYTTGLPDAIADRIFALDMFFGIRQPTEFLSELKRLIKPDGILVIDDGHQPREATRRKILDSGLWQIESESKDHLGCRPA